MKSNGFFYFLREGFKGIFVHGFMSFAAICIIVACLLLMGSFTLIAANVDTMMKDFESESEILAYVDENLSDADARSIGTYINQLPNVSEAEFISREDATKNFLAKYEGNELFQELNSDNFRHRYRIVLKDISLMEDTVQEVEQVDGIVKVNASIELSEGFVSVRNILSIVCIAMIIVMLVISIFIIANTIKLATFDRREEIAIMKMVGASNGFIRWPFIFQGFILGIFAAAIAFFAQWGLYNLLVEQVVNSDTLRLLEIVPFRQMMGHVAAAFGATGLFVGVFGSALAIRKYLKV